MNKLLLLTGLLAAFAVGFMLCFFKGETIEYGEAYVDQLTRAMTTGQGV